LTASGDALGFNGAGVCEREFPSVDLLLGVVGGVDSVYLDEVTDDDAATGGRMVWRL